MAAAAERARRYVGYPEEDVLRIEATPVAELPVTEDCDGNTGQWLSLLGANRHGSSIPCLRPRAKSRAISHVISRERTGA
jgi:hypothetical protein